MSRGNHNYSEKGKNDYFTTAVFAAVFCAQNLSLQSLVGFPKVF